MNKRDRPRCRLTLHRETLHRLDERRLQALAGRGVRNPMLFSEDRLCTSPWCGLTTCGCEENG